MTLTWTKTAPGLYEAKGNGHHFIVVNVGPSQWDIRYGDDVFAHDRCATLREAKAGCEFQASNPDLYT